MRCHSVVVCMVLFAFAGALNSPAQTTVNITVGVGATTAGLSVIVDGSIYNYTVTVQWTPGTQHTLSVASPQSLNPGAQFVFSNWSDGGAQTHTVTAPSAATSYTANFTEQYQLTTAADPNGGGSISPATGWFNAGSVVPVSATANSGYQFTGFSGALTGTSNPQNLSIGGPQTVTANFSATSPGSYNYSRTITIAYGQVPNTNQTNFPFLFNTTDPLLKTVANGGHVNSANGYDIIFTSDAAGTQRLNHEIESYNGSTGQFIAWVQIPTLSHTANTVIYLFYGNSSITTSQEYKTGVWDSGYQSVWHMKETSGTTLYDSTGNARNATKSGANDPAPATGFIGGGQSFVGTPNSTANDYATFAPTAPVDTYSVQFWLYQLNSTSDESVVVTAGNTTTEDTWSSVGFGYYPTNQLCFRDHYNEPCFATVSMNVWHQIAVVRNGDSLATYIDGAPSQSTTGMGDGTETFGQMGFYGANASDSSIDGTLDELRISNTVRSADWIATEYHNQSSPSTFYTVGSESGGSSGSGGMTVSTSPSGLVITVDGTNYTAPQTFQWTAGSSHTIAVSSPLAGTTGTQYVFANWSDGGAQSHTVSAPTSATTYTANFTTQYLLTTVVSPTAGGTISPSTAWYNAGQSMPVTATASSGYAFTGFSGDLQGFSNPQPLTMSVPHSVTASFSNTAITIATSPLGLAFTVDGTPYTTGVSLNWVAGSSHTISAVSPQAGATAGLAPGSQYLFAKWSNGGSQTQTITAPSTATTYTATFNIQYSLTAVVNPPGSGTISATSGWYSAGATVPVSATPASGYTFIGFSQALNGTTSSQTLVMTGPLTVTANFAGGGAITVTSSPSGLSIIVDGTQCTAPCSFQWAPRSSHSLGLTSPQTLSSTQYGFSYWSDSGAQSHQVTAPTSATTFTATFAPVTTTALAYKDYIRLGSRVLAIEYPTSSGSTQFQISPSSVALMASQVQSFSTTPLDTNGTLTWSLVPASNSGTLTPTTAGSVNYTAPSTVPTSAVTLKAADGSNSSTATINFVTLSRGTVSPSGSTGASQTFTITASDVNTGGIGGTEPGVAVVFAPTSLTSMPTSPAPNTCWVSANPSVVYLATNAGQFTQSGAFGSSTVLSNSQCTINLATATASISGSTVTIVLPVTFSASYAGAQNIWESVTDVTSAASGWGIIGSWTVPGFQISPSSVALMAGQAQSFSTTPLDTNSTLTWSLSPSSNSGTLSSTTAGSVNYTAPSAVPTSAVTLKATDGSDSSTATINFVTLSRGTVSPTGSSGLSQKFTITASDVNTGGIGGTEPGVAVVFAPTSLTSMPTSPAPNTCWVSANPSVVYLATNAGQFTQSGAFGSSTVLSNSQCSINLATATASISGSTVTMVLPVTFSVSYAGAQNIWESVTDVTSAASGWGIIGSWTVPAETVSTPNTPTGTTSGFVGVSYTYTAGGAVDNAGNPIQYEFVWGDGSNSGWLAAGTTTTSHSWSSASTNSVTVQARSSTNNAILSATSSALSVTIKVETVSTPSAPTGTTSGSIGTSYSYTASGAVDNAGNAIQYEFTWGDGTNSGWLASGTTSASHTWSSASTFSVTLQARSATNTSIVSGTSSALSVTMTDPLPTLVSFGPSGSHGTTQTFTISVKDLAGYTNSSFYYQAIFSSSSTLSTANSCGIEYVPSTNLLYLDSSSGNYQWVNPSGTAPGSSGTLSNGQCQINFSSSSASNSGTTSTLNVSVTFQVNGTRYLFLSATNQAGNTAWTSYGSWGVP